MTAFKPIKEGKVREIYDNGNSLIMVATDRISAFDVILKNKVTKKGTVLTQMSKFWFDYTKDLLPNHMLSVDVKDIPYMQSEVNQEENLNRIITVPNLLSFFRLCLIPVIIWSYCVKKNPLLAGEILLLSGLTDLADGYIARRFHRISNLGKILDPVADKLTQAAMLICLFTRFPHVLLLIVIMAGKELYMVVSGCLVIRKTGKVHGADWHGKIVTFLLYGTAAVHIIWFHITPMVSDLLIGLCAIMMVISVALYIIQNTRTLKGETV